MVTRIALSASAASFFLSASVDGTNDLTAAASCSVYVALNRFRKAEISGVVSSSRTSVLLFPYVET